MFITFKVETDSKKITLTRKYNTKKYPQFYLAEILAILPTLGHNHFDQV